MAEKRFEDAARLVQTLDSMHDVCISYVNYPDHESTRNQMARSPQTCMCTHIRRAIEHLSRSCSCAPLSWSWYVVIILMNVSIIATCFFVVTSVNIVVSGKEAGRSFR